MADRPDRSDMEAGAAPVPVWARNMRLTKEQLAAAERTLDYHLRKLQRRMAAEPAAGEPPTRNDH